MSDLTFRRLRLANVDRVSQFDGEFQLHDWSEMEWGCAAAGEMGELCNALKKRARSRKHNEITGKTTLSNQDVADEAADVVIYLDLLLAQIGQDLGEAVRRKFNAVSDRAGCRTCL